MPRLQGQAGDRTKGTQLLSEHDRPQHLGGLHAVWGQGEAEGSAGGQAESCLGLWNVICDVTYIYIICWGWKKIVIVKNGMSNI